MPEDSRSLKELALEVVGSFSRLQEVIDLLSRRYFDKRTPGLAEFVERRALRRSSDEERKKIFKLLVVDLIVDVPVDSFGQVFGEVKKMRDSLAHGSNYIVEEGDVLTVVESFVLSVDGTRNDSQFTREQLVKSLRKCDWLIQCVQYALTESDLTKEVYLGSTRVRAVRPTDDPEDWDGGCFVSA